MVRTISMRVESAQCLNLLHSRMQSSKDRDCWGNVQIHKTCLGHEHYGTILQDALHDSQR